MAQVLFSRNKYSDDTHFFVPDEIGMYAGGEIVNAYDEIVKRKWIGHNNPSGGYKDVPHLSIITCATKEDLANGWPHTIYLHRFIYGLKKGDKREVDHMGTWLENTPDKTRIASHGENSLNRRGPKRINGLPRGVQRQGKRFKATIVYKRKTINLGVYNTATEAHEAYRRGALKYHGAFANFASA